MISVWRKTAARSLSFLVSMAACAAFPAGLYILDDASSLTNAVSNALSGQGLEARRIPLEEINVSPMRSDFAALWVVPNFATVRNNTFELIQRHLADGGSLLCVGDPPFQKVLYPDGNQWVTSSEYLVKSLTPQSILSFEGMKPADARLGTDGPEEKNSIVFEKDKSPGIPSAPKTIAQHRARLDDRAFRWKRRARRDFSADGLEFDRDACARDRRVEPRMALRDGTTLGSRA